jgi:hypothetical protein
METPRMQSTTNELLARMVVLQQAYENAKKELNDVRKKLHGTPVISWERSSKQPFGSSTIVPASIKRGRGRPRKVACVVETVDNSAVVDNNRVCTDGDDSLTPSCETPMVCDELENDYNNDDFKGAVFTFISDGMYIETREGKFYDIHTRELRGWFNPYTQRAEWL